MNIRWLQYLLKVVECGSITEAAEQLYISQPALTKAMRSLESEYGIQILKRTRKGIELTAEGKNFAYYAYKVVDSANILEKNYKKVGRPGNGQVRLFLASQQFDFLNPILVDLYRENADCKEHFTLLEADRNEAIEMLLNVNVGLALIVTHEQDGMTMPWKGREEELAALCLDSAPIYAAVGPQSPFYECDCIPAGQVTEQPSLVLDVGGSAIQNLNMDNRLDLYNYDKIVFTNSLDTCREFLERTDMLLFISKWSAKALEGTGIRVLPVVDDNGKGRGCENHLMLYKRRNAVLNPTEKRFTELMLRHFGKNPDESEWLNEKQNK